MENDVFESIVKSIFTLEQNRTWENTRNSEKYWLFNQREIKQFVSQQFEYLNNYERD